MDHFPRDRLGGPGVSSSVLRSLSRAAAASRLSSSCPDLNEQQLQLQQQQGGNDNYHRGRSHAADANNGNFSGEYTSPPSAGANYNSTPTSSASNTGRPSRFGSDYFTPPSRP